MTKKAPKKPIQNASRKSVKALPAPSGAEKSAGAEIVTLPVNLSGSLSWWIDQYFKFEVTKAASSKAVQRRDLALFLSYVQEKTGGDEVAVWTPRLSRSFQDRLRKEIDVKDGQGFGFEGRQRLGDRAGLLDG